MVWPLSCRRAVLTLLPKEGDLQLRLHWRPVSLLCPDYKLLSKVFSSTLSKVMGHVLHRGYTCCVPAWWIIDNGILIRGFSEICKLFCIKAGLYQLSKKKFSIVLSMNIHGSL